ncbi:MAG: alanine--tRNA ligase-related protein, partial [Raoultibacter sp.]
RQGQAYLDDVLAALEGDELSGEAAFTLHDTYGFPIEVTEEITDARGIKVDLEGFARCMDEQKARARANAKDADKAWSTYGGVMSEILEESGTTEFLGYTKDSAEVHVVAIVQDGKLKNELSAGESGEIICDKTPFYAEKGGQVGDEGVLRADGISVKVTDTQEPEKGLIAHTVIVEAGMVEPGMTLQAEIDIPRRERIRRNHTATHVLHWALRQVLGDHVKQAGSFVAPNRLRFDFTHFEGMTLEQIAEVERLSNEKIMENHAVRAYETSITSAREAGVIALFGEKYGEFVRVLDIEGISQELCGGTHVAATSEIGFVKITGESSVGANLRRIEAVTSFDALAYMNKVEEELKETAAELKVPLFDVSERTATNIKTIKDFTDKRKRNKQIVSDGEMLSVIESAINVGYPLIIANLGTADVGGLRNAWDVLRARMTSPGAAVLAADNHGVPILLAAGAPEAVEAGFNAGAIIKAISPAIKGGGGGKPEMAQAGGKDAAGIDAALEAARELFAQA